MPGPLWSSRSKKNIGHYHWKDFCIYWVMVIPVAKIEVLHLTGNFIICHEKVMSWKSSCTKKACNIRCDFLIKISWILYINEIILSTIHNNGLWFFPCVRNHLSCCSQWTYINIKSKVANILSHDHNTGSECICPVWQLASFFLCFYGKCFLPALHISWIFHWVWKLSFLIKLH